MACWIVDLESPVRLAAWSSEQETKEKTGRSSGAITIAPLPENQSPSSSFVGVGHSGVARAQPLPVRKSATTVP